MFEHRFTLEVIETIGDTSTYFILPVSFIFLSVLHVFLILVTFNKLQLDCDEEECYTFEHHGSQASIDLVIELAILLW